MKVCTDACVLGAYADVDGQRILDIGTGTGLLALMVAQRNPMARIDAVEIDDAAFMQATENTADSPFAQRVHIIHNRIQNFYPAITYDRILTNPPFYTNHLRSSDAAINRALHTDELPFTELVATIERLLNPNGQWWVLLPRYETEKLSDLAESIGLYPGQQLRLRHHMHKPVFRVITGFSFRPVSVKETELAIYEPDGRTYTTEFRELLRDFYLIF